MTPKIIIGLIGEKGSGKGTVSDYLIAHYGAEHFGTSQILKRTVSDLHLELTRDNFIKLALVLKEGFGASVVIDSLIHDIEDQSKADIVIADGIRMHDDVEPFKKRYGSNFHLIYVTADMRIRYERTKLRKEKAGEDKMTWPEFIAEEARLTEVAIHEVGRQADFIIENNGIPEELTSQVEAVMKKILV
ncbi:MAG: AAA family ATPase [Candidatus Falkowbacteria bacterium]